jgi:hypothetical protein
VISCRVRGRYRGSAHATDWTAGCVSPPGVYLIISLAALLAVELGFRLARHRLIRGALVGLYPYPFIDAGRLGYARVFLNAGGMLIAFICISLALVALDRAKRSPTPGLDARR